MSERLQKTQSMLAKHHRDGDKFAEMMKESFARRFDDTFWSDWEAWISPVCGTDATVLDLGAGPGMFVKTVAERYDNVSAIGVECADYMLDAAVELPPGSRLLAEDLHDPHFPIDEASVDAAICSVVIHEMDQPVRLLQELARCMKPGGRFMLLDWVRAPLEVYVRAQTEEARVFDAQTPTDELDDLFVHFMEHNRFTLDDLVYLLNRTGFAVLHTQVTREGRYARIIAERRA